ncbi:MAG TPA: TetR family transcriptional regulator [Bacteroidia bacterium]|nr:TetR family transcriptional regulator [Bacteroidia bacterium]HNP97567.1 TetR family transcriptional regulator [Bacteroidia bacterium]
MTKREQILEVAEELIAENGFEATSVRSLASKAGINVAMISYYFGSKEKLFEALVEYRAGFLREKFQTLNKEVEDPLLRMEQMIDAYVDRIFSHHRFHRILHRQMMSTKSTVSNENILNILLKNAGEVKKMIQDGEQKKVFRKVDIEFTIAMLIGTISQIAVSCLLTSRIVGVNPNTESIHDEQYKVRAKIFLTNLMRTHLTGK